MNQWLTSQSRSRAESNLGSQPLHSEAVTCIPQVAGHYVNSARLTPCT